MSNFKTATRTQYGVYIIEFLRSDDYTDGDNLHEILKLSLIPTKYEWIETKDEFIHALKNFSKSKYRYLHISCHADETGLEINSDKITNLELQKMTKGKLDNKRLFLSACKGANRDLASRIISKNNAFSLVGIPTNLNFDKSALFWPSFYHLVNEIDANRMKRFQIIDVIKNLVELFNIPVDYYSKINNNPDFLRRLKIRIGKTENHQVKVKYNNLP
jgi:hypothetical protein